MKDDEKKPKPEEPKPEEPKPEEPKPEEPKPEEPKPEPESAIIKRMREDYEKKITDLTKDYEAKLADKDKTILDILDGKPAPEMGIAERINKTRNFKKY